MYLRDQSFFEQIEKEDVELVLMHSLKIYSVDKYSR
jgi:hypothetical protein